MPSVLLIITASPYGTDTAYHALRLAKALVEASSAVTVFLMADATGAAVAGASAGPDTNLADRLADLARSGATVKVCGLCLETRGYHTAPLVEGAQMGSMPELAALVASSDRVLTF